MAETSPYFAADPYWRAYAERNGIAVGSDECPKQTSIDGVEIPIEDVRQYEKQADQQWVAAHPLSSVGYEAYSSDIPVRDGTSINIRVTYPSEVRLSQSSVGAGPLPVVFVVHGGGYISGTHLSEEAWLVRPLQAHLELVTVSVEYRLAPEHKFPVWIEDTWDVLQHLLRQRGETLPDFIQAKMDFNQIILAGSSAGAGICAVLSQMCRNQRLEVFGIVLNVPTLCEYRSFPSPTGISRSYLECNQAMLGSAQLASCWDLVTSGASPTDTRLSPLLGQLDRLPRHIVCVAGRDPVREDGLEYVARLERANVPVTLHLYPGVPHDFAQNIELPATKAFSDDIVRGVRSWVRG